MEDSRIIELYVNRSEDAVRESEQKYGRYCLSIALHILHDAEDTEECVNDTWMSAWNSIPPVIPNILKVYLGKITRNHALNRYQKMNAEKRKGSETSVILEELEECIADPGASVSEDRIAVRTALNRFLEGLPGEKRIIFVKRYWYAETVREISDELGISESKVKMTLLRMRKSLSEHLTREGITI